MQTPRKIALLTGINTYPTAPLHGTNDDVLDVSQFLLESRGFQKTDIIPLLNERATTDAILTYLEQTVDLLQPGDDGLWQFSGHGIQFPSKNIILEPDGLDEGICPVDFNWDPRYMILDTQIHEILLKLRPGVNFTCLMDCCHSGNLDREMPPIWTMCPQLIKTFPAHADMLWDQDVAKLCGFEAHKDLIVQDIPLGVSFISACRSDQTAADAFIGNRFNGACTYYLLSVLRQMPIETPLTTIVVKVNELLHARGFSQVVQLDGEQIHNPFMYRIPISA